MIITLFPRSKITRFHAIQNRVTLVTARKRLRRLCFYTCLSVCPQRGLPECMLGYHLPGPGTPKDQAAPGADIPRSRLPLDQAPPGTRYPPGPGTPSSRHPQPPTPHPPAPKAVHAGRYSQQAGSMHPTGMQSCYLYFF